MQGLTLTGQVEMRSAAPVREGSNSSANRRFDPSPDAGHDSHFTYLRQSAKPNMGVEVVGFELDKFTGLFDIDSAPIRIAAVCHVNRGAVPVGFSSVERDVVFVKAVDEYRAASA